jgi:hypothetical protein
MANLMAAKAAASVPVYKEVGSDSCVKRISTLAVALAPSLNDKWYMLKLPRCKVVGGMMKGRKLDTNGSPTLRLDVGTLAGYTRDVNGVPSGGTLSQTSIHADTVAITGAGVGDHVLADGSPLFMQHFNKLVDGEVLLPDAETIVVVNATAVAATFAAGNFTIEIEYVDYP